MFSYLKLFFFIAILLFGSFLYLYQIEKIPPGLAADEVPNGYNAYSILLTGKDEFGKYFPISFRFSAAYSPPLYTYLTIPAISLMGLNITSTRIVSVISGILSIVVVFFLLKGLNLFQNRFVIYLSTLLYMCSPWTVMYSRSGYEAMLSFLIYATGILFIWKGFQKPIYLTVGIIVLSSSVYASYTNRLLAPLTVISVVLIFKNLLLAAKIRKYLLIGLIGAIVLQIPNLSLIFTQSFLVKSDRFISHSVFNQYQNVKNIIPPFIGIPYFYIREFLSQYLTYFSPRSLFLDPDPFKGRAIPDLSTFYPWMVIPYLIGLFTIWKKRTQSNYKFLLLLMVITPIPAALTRDPFWTYRAIPLLGLIVIVISIGVDKIAQSKIRLFFMVFSLIVVYSLILLWKNYFVFLTNENSAAWEYGYQNLAQELLKYKESIVVDNTRRPLTYLQLVFFMKLPPKVLQNAVREEIKNDYYNNLDTQSDYSFENIDVRPIFWKTDIYKEQILVGDNLTFSEQQIRDHMLTRVFQIKYPLKNVVFEGYKTDPLKVCLDLQAKNLPLDPMCNY